MITLTSWQFGHIPKIFPILSKKDPGSGQKDSSFKVIDSQRLNWSSVSSIRNLSSVDNRSTSLVDDWVKIKLISNGKPGAGFHFLWDIGHRCNLWLPRVGKFLKNISPNQCFHRFEDLLCVCFQSKYQCSFQL